MFCVPYYSDDTYFAKEQEIYGASYKETEAEYEEVEGSIKVLNHGKSR
jgi:hypothetical protein